LKLKFYPDEDIKPAKGYYGVKSGSFEDLIHDPETLAVAAATLYKAAADAGSTDNLGCSILCGELTYIADAVFAEYMKWKATEM